MDELDERLRRTDPLASGWSPEPSASPRARALLEQIMSTAVENDLKPAAPRRPAHGWRWIGALAAAGIVIAGVVGGLVIANRDDGSQPTAAAPATFQLPASDTAAMCLAVTEYRPDPSAQAFGGTVTGIDPSTVTLNVDRWYAGGDEQPDVVNLAADPNMPSVALDGVEFEVGRRYLVTVVEGAVQICGISAPASPELEALYEQWYGS